MLAKRLRRWATISPAMGELLVSAGLWQSLARQSAEMSGFDKVIISSGGHPKPARGRGIMSTYMRRPPGIKVSYRLQK